MHLSKSGTDKYIRIHAANWHEIPGKKSGCIDDWVVSNSEFTASVDAFGDMVLAKTSTDLFILAMDLECSFFLLDNAQGGEETRIVNK